METREEILREFGLIIAATRPEIIKKVRPYIDCVETNMEGNKKCLIVSVDVYMETEDHYTSFPWIADADSFESLEEREKVKEERIEWLMKILKKDINNPEIKDYWEGRNLDEETWKRKEE